MDPAILNSSTHHHPPDHSHLDPQGQLQLIKSDNALAASAGNVVDHSSKHGQGLGGTSQRGAPPTNTPTSGTQHHPPSTSRPNVGLLKAQSPWLRKDGVCIAVLEDKSVSCLIKGCPFS